MITVIANGHKQILEVKIKEEVVDPKISKCYKT